MEIIEADPDSEAESDSVAESETETDSKSESEAESEAEQKRDMDKELMSLMNKCMNSPDFWKKMKKIEDSSDKKIVGKDDKMDVLGFLLFGDLLICPDCDNYTSITDEKCKKCGSTSKPVDSTVWSEKNKKYVALK